MNIHLRKFSINIIIIRRMKIKNLFITLCVLTLFSCSNNSIDEVTVDSTSLNHAESVCSDTTMLDFASESDFQNAVDELSTVDEQNRSEFIKMHFGNMVSLKDTYDEAMSAAELLDESSVSYESFKNKYGKALYFANYKDDYGVYLPVSNKVVASLVNANGDVRINGNVKNMKDIFCYAQLQQLGIAMYDYCGSHVTRSAADVTAEYDSDWYHENGKKIRVKCGRQILIDSKILTTPVSMRMHIEISFRKKTWLGWTNYSSNIELTGTYSVANVKTAIHEDKTADSSHDYYYGLPNAMPVKMDNLNSYMRLALPISVDLKIDYRGIPHELDYQFTLPAAYM